MRFAISAFLLALSFGAQADSCWIISKVGGITAFASDNYQFSKDGFRDAVFVLRIKEDANHSGGRRTLIVWPRASNESQQYHGHLRGSAR